MTKINDGGPAFPTLETDSFHPQFGMSLRDYFAAQAMVGLTMHNGEYVRHVLATECYQYADAMLAERAKAETP